MGGHPVRSRVALLFCARRLMAQACLRLVTQGVSVNLKDGIHQLPRPDSIKQPFCHAPMHVRGLLIDQPVIGGVAPTRAVQAEYLNYYARGPVGPNIDLDLAGLECGEHAARRRQGISHGRKPLRLSSMVGIADQEVALPLELRPPSLALDIAENELPLCAALHPCRWHEWREKAGEDEQEGQRCQSRVQSGVLLDVPSAGR